MLIVWLALLVFAASPAAAASVSLAPASGPPGAETAVTATGLAPHRIVEMRVGAGETELLLTDEEGRLDARAQIPADALGTVRVAVSAGKNEHTVFGYRVASPFASHRAAESSDWRGHVMRVATKLDQGLLQITVQLRGLQDTASIAVMQDGRRVASGSARPRRETTIRLELPGDAVGQPLRVRASDVRLAARLQTPPAVLAAVGDIACRPGAKVTRTTCRHADTALTAAGFRPDAVALLGDIQYESGHLEDFRASFHPTWGQLEMPLRPVPGNHEYRVEGARDYFDYFAEQARWRPPSWYAYNLGPWHIVALNSNCERDGVPCEAGGLQEQWLRADLAASPQRCTLAYWHHARYSSGFHGSDPRTAPFWRTLQQAGADLVVAGHDHNYERFAPQNATGQADPNGLRSFVAGTGGKDVTKLREPLAPHSQYGRDDAHGVMIFRLYENAYSWRFVRIDGKVLDFGSGTCV